MTDTDARLIERDWCDDCHAHIIPMPLWERALSWVCWFLAMHWPDRFFMSRPHATILPWAGNIAYRCHCPRAALGDSK